MWYRMEIIKTRIIGKPFGSDFGEKEMYIMMKIRNAIVQNVKPDLLAVSHEIPYFILVFQVSHTPIPAKIINKITSLGHPQLTARPTNVNRMM